MAREHVRRAYSGCAAEYTELLGSIEHTARADRDYVAAWAKSVDGPIVDVGCGPGQWTHFLAERGSDIVGIDPVPAFIAEARARYGASRFRAGDAEALGVSEGSLGGVLAWYSLIHEEPSSIGAAFTSIARALKPGGTVLLGFFDGDARTPFSHAVATAYFWSEGALGAELGKAGLRVREAVCRQDPGARPHGALIAQKAGLA